MNNVRLLENLLRDLYVVKNEDNLYGSEVNPIWPSTILDQVFDNKTVEKKTLRQILEEMKQEIITGGEGNILFPVDSVNGMTGDVVITKNTIGLNNVDNTRDIDKPLSNVQREEVNNIIRNFDFRVDLSSLYEHLSNSDNPHGVTLEQLNQDNKLDNLISQFVTKHNLSTSSNTHSDIRRNLAGITQEVNKLNDTMLTKLNLIKVDLTNHIGNSHAHADLFATKENTSNKVPVIDRESTLIGLYPTDKAVIKYVTDRLVEYDSTLLKINKWLEDINVIENRSQLPIASKNYFQQIYFIKYGITSHNELAVCRKNDNGTYAWDITDLGAYTSFNPNHFVNGLEGLSLNITPIVDEILNIPNMSDHITRIAERILPEYIGNNYYTKNQIDAMHPITDINILKGTEYGTIRYYINNRLDTMSHDIKIPGLQRLAFLDNITENEIVDQAVQERHILSKQIVNRHLSNNSVKYNNITASKGTIIANLDSDQGNCTEVPIQYLADMITHMDVLLKTYPEESITQDVNNIFDEV